jgi:hypothetical protein
LFFIPLKEGLKIVPLKAWVLKRVPLKEGFFLIHTLRGGLNLVTGFLE